MAARAIVLAKEGDGRGAITLAKVARAQAQGLGLRRGELVALNAVAVVHLLRGDSISAVAAAMDALQLARELDERGMEAEARVSLHFASFNLGARDGIEAGLRACVAEAVERMDRGLEVRARAVLGIVYGDGACFDAAALEFERALVTARMHDGPTCPARLLANLANLHRKRAAAHFAAGFEARALRECHKAEMLARRACGMAARDGSVAIEVDALAIAGCLRLMKGQVAQALAHFEEALAIGRASRWRAAIVWVLCEMAELLASEGEVERARVAYVEALDIASQLRPSCKVARACDGLARVAARRGDVHDAMQWRERARDEAAEYERARRQTREQVESFLLAA